MLRVARAVMSNHTFDDLVRMMIIDDIPALEQALNEGADVNMLDEVDPLNPAANELVIADRMVPPI